MAVGLDLASPSGNIQYLKRSLSWLQVPCLCRWEYSHRKTLLVSVRMAMFAIIMAGQKKKNPGHAFRYRSFFAIHSQRLRPVADPLASLHQMPEEQQQGASSVTPRCPSSQDRTDDASYALPERPPAVMVHGGICPHHGARLISCPR